MRAPSVSKQRHLPTGSDSEGAQAHLYAWLGSQTCLKTCRNHAEPTCTSSWCCNSFAVARKLWWASLGYSSIKQLPVLSLPCLLAGVVRTGTHQMLHEVQLPRLASRFRSGVDVALIANLGPASRRSQRGHLCGPENMARRRYLQKQTRKCAILSILSNYFVVDFAFCSLSPYHVVRFSAVRPGVNFSPCAFRNLLLTLYLSYCVPQHCCR